MAKHFRLRITRVFRTKHSPPITTTTTIPQPSKRRRISSFKRRLSSAFLCRCSSKFNNYSDDETTAKPLDLHWQNDHQEWNVVTQNDDESPRQKIYNSSVSGGDSDDTDILAPTLLPPPPPQKKRRRRKKKTTLKHNRISTSSAETETLVSSSKSFSPEETETLVSSSSRSFSTDDSSTEYNPQLKTIREKPTRHKKPKKKKSLEKMTSSSRCSVTLSSGSESPARLSVFRKLIPCAVEGKVKESFAVVKKSVDPFEDFKKSMSDMILEKEMFEEKELEQLLQCFLSLNSRQHHGVIVQAFAEIWNSMFSVNSTAAAAAVSN